MATKYGGPPPASSSFSPHARVPRNSASRASMLRKRVLPLAEFAAEVACGNGQATKLPANERRRKFGTTIAPIPVPLAPGESEAHYERVFDVWLKSRGMSLDELSANPNANRERTTRCSYANYLAKAFLATGAPAVISIVKKDNELEEGEEIEDEEEHAATTSNSTTAPLDLATVPRKMLNTTQVTTLAAYREDVASGKFTMFGFMSTTEKMRQFGLPVVPIAVPLAPGETEQQYEERFLLWLVREKRMTLGGLQTHKVPMLERYMRLEFASLNGKGLLRFVSPRTPPVKRPAETSEMMNLTPAKKVKTMKQEIKTVIPQEKASKDERPSTSQPPKVEPPQEEALSLPKNAADDNTTNVEENAAPTSSDQPYHPMLAQRVMKMDDYAAELRESKQVVAARLKRELDVQYAPIPVPLEPGDTEEQYEQRFQHSSCAAKRSLSPESERVIRCNYAIVQVREYEARTNKPYADKTRTPESVDNGTKPEPTAAKEAASPASTPSLSKKEEPTSVVASSTSTATTPLPSHARDTKRYVDLEQYRRECRKGLFSKPMTTKEKMARFGMPVLPIFVPLAQGESAQQYEDRFTNWLKKHFKTTPDAIRHKAKDRWCRVQFANRNGKGGERFDPVRFPKRERSELSLDNNEDGNAVPEPSKTRKLDDDAESKKCPQQGDADAVCCATDPTSYDACAKCRCDACLVRAMQLLSETISSMESEGTCPCTTTDRKRSSDVVLDLIVDDDIDAVAPQAETVSPPISKEQDMQRVFKMAADDVEEKLQSEYDLLNEQIILNQEALDASVAQLAQDPPVDMAEMTQLHEENEEVREVIQEAYGNRTQALALLVLYQWRNDRDGLERMLRDPSASDVAHVQQLSHQKCVAHASKVAAVRQQCALLEQQISVATQATKDLVQQLTDKLKYTRIQLQELQYQRRYECVMLVHFDQHLRQLLEALLRRVDP